MFKTPWSQKTFAQRLATIGSMIGFFFGCIILAYAITSLITSGQFGIHNPPKHIFTIDLTGQVPAVEMGPGDEQTIAPSIKNTGTEKMYVFVRFNCSDDGVYEFVPAEGSNWTKVDSDVPGEMIYAYGDPDKLIPGDSATLSGKMKVVATNVMFSEWFDAGTAEDVLYYTVTGCAIGTDAESSGAAALYDEYVSSGGQ